MLENIKPLTQRTAADVVFDQLHDEILTLKLLPGSRISEADVANRLGVSRQPVRDAFNRLGNLNLLKIRPQRATEVRGFSWQQIENKRFIRLAVELEVSRRAAANWNDQSAAMLEANLTQQRDALARDQIAQFHNLDYEFHQLICTISGLPLAFETIKSCKQQVDRLCVLSLALSNEMSALLEDHEEIAHGLANLSPQDVETSVRRHLGRLDASIKEIREKHPKYFE